MSTCISRHGEYSEHQPGEEHFVCDWCGSFDQEGALAEIVRLRTILAARAQANPAPDGGLREVIEAHRFQWRTAGTWCACGWGGVHFLHGDYDEHLVAVLAPVETREQIKAESLREAIERLHGGTHWCFDANGGDVVFERDTEWWPCPTYAAAIIATPVETREQIKAEALREMAQLFRDAGPAAWGGSWLTTGERVADLVASWCEEEANELAEADQ